MAFQKAKIKETTAHRCIRHGCVEPVSWRVATTHWWKQHDGKCNDGFTGIVFECCEEHVGAGWKVRNGD